MLYDIIESPDLLVRNEKKNKTAASYLRDECNHHEIHSGDDLNLSTYFPL